MSGGRPMPLRPIDNIMTRSRSSRRQSAIPVGDRDKGPKIQLCFELRNKDVTKKRPSKKLTTDLEPVLEVAVMCIKNLPRGQLPSSGQGTFVKLQLMPGKIIHSTELKIHEKNEEKVDFVEVFDFPVKKDKLLKGKTMEVLVCDGKMTRNCSIYGRTAIKLEDLQFGTPVSNWYSLKPQV